MHGAPDLDRVREGDVIAGKYRVDRILGAGGMGVVVAAHHLQLEERVALKFLRPEVASRQDMVARFLREARAAVRIKSEHVARVSDVGTLENGLPYMVMEYLEGGDLAAWLEQRGPLPVEQAVDFVIQACVAVAEAHSLGIVHRDLKPANLFCVRRADGQLSIKVLDFGISKLTQSGEGPDLVRTKTAMAMGSPLYMSPEQMVSARDVDGRTDIWALGAILYELVSGRTPFVAESFAGLVLEVTQGQLKPLGQARRGVHPGLEAVVARCLAKNRADRYETVADFALALGPFAPERARLPIERAVRILRGSGASNAAIQETLAQSMRRAPSSADDVRGSSPATSERGPQFPTNVNWVHTAKEGTKRRTATFVALGGIAVAGIALATYLHGRSADGAQQSFSGEASSSHAGAPAVGLATATASPAPPAAQPAPAPDEARPSSAAAPAITPAASESAAVATAAAVAAHDAPRPTRAAHGSKGHTAAVAPAPAAPAAAAPSPAPAPAPQPTAPRGSAYDDM